MLYVNIPTREEVLRLAEFRADICISIYMKTSPLPQNMKACSVTMSNMLRDAFDILEERFDKRKLAFIKAELEELTESDDFWVFHAHSLAILASPGKIRVYRLANDLQPRVEISDRFYLKPLLRAVTFPHNAYVLALSENEARVVEFFADAPPEELHLPHLPKNALEGANRQTLTIAQGNMSGGSDTRGYKLRLGQYARKVDEALRPLLLHNESPLILVCTERLAAIYRSVSSLDNLLEDTVFISPDRLSVSELVTLARPLMDKYHARQLEEIKALMEQRDGENRVLTDLTDVAKATTYGNVSLLLVDFDKQVNGEVDENGAIQLSDASPNALTGTPGSYGVIDEIVRRALACGARVLSLRAADMPGQTGVAAVLRYSA